MEFPELETNRLRLVKITYDYTKELYDILSRKEVMKYYGMDRISNYEEAAQVIESYRKNFANQRGIRWGIVIKDSNVFVGTIGLSNLLQKKAEVGFELHPDYWRKGYISEAFREILRYSFEELDLFRLGAATFPENTASIFLLEKFDFEKEGCLRGYFYQNKTSYDALIFSVIYPEWKRSI
ncbi:GNAT family N-acetyltransferase [Bacillus sp. H-16]|uniref:GNAT family N-acetyltransferase n=1 Tax=Alteribacter salitolerans TaxID=2912333 RepID=UPI00196486F9|nr:GNAT family protein [Alteribacter salitolerans]MBM7097470.1 GNAT family N-acetyltransferase [Alteribacter salitolerans]